MARPLEPKTYEAAHAEGKRAERREQARREMHREIEANRGGNGVVVIPPSKKLPTGDDMPKLRVAAYCRVSTQEEQQLGSFNIQVQHYEQRIKSNPAWELVSIYQDEGISGTSVTKRLGFQKMIADAKEGKIDLILTKGINRFGRNVVDVLDSLRILSSLTPPVTVEFEADGITSSGSASNNLLITILSTLAELESQQKSEAIKAGIRWRMAEGIYKFAVHHTLGYYRDHFGRLLIEPSEAKVVEYIYESCLEGASPTEIADALTAQNIPTPLGKNAWHSGTVHGILRNEKYCGDALMQKTYTKDFRTHLSVKNTELNMYFKEGHHAPIIKKADWHRVQDILSLRCSVEKVAKLRQFVNRFVAVRVKDGLFKGYYILDSRWSASERRGFLQIISEAFALQNTKGE